MPGGQSDLMLFGIPHFDKIGHFGMYAVWALLVYYAFSGLFVFNSRRPHDLSGGAGSALRFDFRNAFFISMLVVGLIGVALEFAQFYIARNRSFEVADMVANAGGAIVGAFAGWKGKRLLKQ